MSHSEISRPEDSGLSGLRLHHVAMAVHSIEQTAHVLELVTGARCSLPETVPEQGVKVAFVGSVELIEPTDADGSVARFLGRRGQGLHHIAYAVSDVAVELARLQEAGFDAIDRVPRKGAGGHRIAFLHPRSTEGVLIELVEEHQP